MIADAEKLFSNLLNLYGLWVASKDGAIEHSENALFAKGPVRAVAIVGESIDHLIGYGLTALTGRRPRRWIATTLSYEGVICHAISPMILG